MIPDYSKAEDSAIEFKEALEEEKVRSWLKSVSAFANTCGGSGTDTPYFYTSDGNNIAYVRQGNQSIPCPRHMLMSLTLKGQNRTYDSYPSAYKANELSFLALAASYKIKIATDFEPERDLVSFGLLDYRSGFLTNAGVLFSDQAPYIRLFFVLAGTDRQRELLATMPLMTKNIMEIFFICWRMRRPL